MKEHGQNCLGIKALLKFLLKSFGTQLRKSKSGMHPDIPFRMIICRLGTVFHRKQFRHQFQERTTGIPQIKGQHRIMHHRFDKLLRNRLPRHNKSAILPRCIDHSNSLFQGLPSLRLKRKMKLCGKAQSAQHPRTVFGKTPIRRSDGAQQTCV